MNDMAARSFAPALRGLRLCPSVDQALVKKSSRVTTVFQTLRNGSCPRYSNQLMQRQLLLSCRQKMPTQPIHQNSTNECGYRHKPVAETYA